MPCVMSTVQVEPAPPPPAHALAAACAAGAQSCVLSSFHHTGRTSNAAPGALNTTRPSPRNSGRWAHHTRGWAAIVSVTPASTTMLAPQGTMRGLDSVMLVPTRYLAEVLPGRSGKYSAGSAADAAASSGASLVVPVPVAPSATTE